MKPTRLLGTLLLGAASALAIPLIGCVKKLEGGYQPNVPPVVRLTQALGGGWSGANPADTNSDDRNPQ